MNLLSVAAAKGYLNGTAPSTSQIILETASKFVKSSSGNSNSISMDTVISQISNGISTNMVSYIMMILVTIAFIYVFVNIYFFYNLPIIYILYARMYVYIFVSLYVCMYVSIFVCDYICLYIFIFFLLQH